MYAISVRVTIYGFCTGNTDRPLGVVDLQMRGPYSAKQLIDNDYLCAKFIQSCMDIAVEKGVGTGYLERSEVSGVSVFVPEFTNF